MNEVPAFEVTGTSLGFRDDAHGKVAEVTVYRGASSMRASVSFEEEFRSLVRQALPGIEIHPSTRHITHSLEAADLLGGLSEVLALPLGIPETHACAYLEPDNAFTVFCYLRVDSPSEVQLHCRQEEALLPPPSAEYMREQLQSVSGVQLVPKQTGIHLLVAPEVLSEPGRYEAKLVELAQAAVQAYLKPAQS